MANKCAYGMVTRQMVDDIKKDISEIKKDVKSMANHYSRRLPGWATILFTIGGSLITGLIIFSLTK